MAQVSDRAGKIYVTHGLDGNAFHTETYAYDPLAFNMMKYYEFVSDEYINLFAEQHLQGFILNRIPLLRRLHWREVASCNLLYGRLSDANKQVMEFPEGLTSISVPYFEAGLGIENIFKLFRVDALWRFSYLNHEKVSPFGIRATMQLSF